MKQVYEDFLKMLCESAAAWVFLYICTYNQRYT